VPWLLTFVLVAAAACSSGDAEGDGNAGAPSATAPAALSADDFESVCRGTAVPGATAFEPTTPGTRKVLVFSGEHPEYAQDHTSMPDGWVSRYPDLAATQLVACIDRVSNEKVETCTGYDVDLDGDYSVETFDTVYEVTLYAAVTAVTVDTATFAVPAAGCPSFVLFTEGEETRAWHEPFDDHLEAFLAPHVNG
jgi:hypothetical protein